MEINKATVRELYETVRRLQKVVMEQNRRIQYLEKAIERLGRERWLGK